MRFGFGKTKVAALEKWGVMGRGTYCPWPCPFLKDDEGTSCSCGCSALSNFSVNLSIYFSNISHFWPRRPSSSLLSYLSLKNFIKISYNLLSLLEISSHYLPICSISISPIITWVCSDSITPFSLEISDFSLAIYNFWPYTAKAVTSVLFGLSPLRLFLILFLRQILRLVS